MLLLLLWLFRDLFDRLGSIQQNRYWYPGMRCWFIVDTRLDIPNAYVQRLYFTITRKVRQVYGIRGEEYWDQCGTNRQSHLWFSINAKPAYIFEVEVIPVYSTTTKQYSSAYIPSHAVCQSLSLEPKTYAEQRIFDTEGTLRLAKCTSTTTQYLWPAGSSQNHFSTPGPSSYHPVSDINHMRNEMRILCTELGQDISKKKFVSWRHTRRGDILTPSGTLRRPDILVHSSLSWRYFAYLMTSCYPLGASHPSQRS